jgi:inorganic triphosphatase YgiF
MSMEIELKLDVARHDHAALAESVLLGATPAARSRLISTYYDTPTHDLRAAGCTLRVRHNGDKRIQTIKTGSGGAGLFVRPEWEQEIEGDVPIVDVAARHLNGIVDHATLMRLAPVSKTVVDRTIYIVERDGATIEMAIDEGQIHAAHLREPICEVELELLGGPPAALFGLARVLDAVAPVRLGVLSKSERGYRLAEAAAAPAHALPAQTAEPVLLDPAANTVAAFVTIVQGCIRQFRLNEAPLLADHNAEALHQARVALRRMRSAFALFKPMLADDPQAWVMNREVKRLAALLGAVRDLDVLIPQLDPPGARLPAARAEAFARVAAELASPRPRHLLLDIAEWLLLGAWRAGQEERPAHAFARKVLDRRHRRLHRHGADIAEIGDRRRHRVRLEAKTLRYATDFFAPLFPGKRSAGRYPGYLRKIERVQDRLGTLNDLTVAPRLIAELGEVAPPPPGKKARRRLLPKAQRALDRLGRAKPFWR